jgi:hypothetical protein
VFGVQRLSVLGKSVALTHNLLIPTKERGNVPKPSSR